MGPGERESERTNIPIHGCRLEHPTLPYSAPRLSALPCFALSRRCGTRMGRGGPRRESFSSLPSSCNVFCLALAGWLARSVGWLVGMNVGGPVWENGTRLGVVLRCSSALFGACFSSFLFFFLHFRHETCFENLLAYTRTYYARFVAALYLLCSFIAVAWAWFGGERGRGRPSLGKGFVKLPFSLASDHLERELFLRIAYLSGYKEVGR